MTVELPLAGEEAKWRRMREFFGTQRKSFGFLSDGGERRKKPPASVEG